MREQTDRTSPSRFVRRRCPARWLTWLTAVVAITVSAVAGFATPASAALGPWTRVWIDQFTGASGTAPSAVNWLYDIGHCYPGCPAYNWGTGEIETMTSSRSNVYLDGAGHLAIRPIRSATGAWTSGRIETRRTNFRPPTGGVLRVYARLRLPAVTPTTGKGYWPAFWMLGAPFRGVYTNWPKIGEIDVMENINGSNTAHGVLHCGVYPGGPCNEPTGIGASRNCTTTTCQGGYHTYMMELDYSTSPQQIRWYLDGVKYHTVRSSQVGATTWANATAHGFFIILNVAIGGGWPGMPNASTKSRMPMLIDYVAVATRSRV